MDLIQRYFWFLFVIYIAGYIYFIRKRAQRKKYIPAAKYSKSELNSFLKKILYALSIPAFILGFLQVAGGFPTPFCVYDASFSNPYSMVSLYVVMACWTVSILWIRKAGGARTLSKFSTVLNMPGEEKSVRFLMTASIFASVFTSIYLIYTGTGIQACAAGF